MTTKGIALYVNGCAVLLDVHLLDVQKQVMQLFVPLKSKLKDHPKGGPRVHLELGARVSIRIDFSPFRILGKTLNSVGIFFLTWI